MHVRFYEFGKSPCRVALRSNCFPIALGLQSTGEVRIVEPQRSPDDLSGLAACHIEDAGGHLVVKALRDDALIQVNEAAILSAPLMPGDHLGIGDNIFIVSYECLSKRIPTDLRVKILEN